MFAMVVLEIRSLKLIEIPLNKSLITLEQKICLLVKMMPLLENRPKLLEGKGGGKLIEWWPKPLRTMLSKRPTLVLKEPLVVALGLDPPEIKIDRLVPYEEAVAVVQKSPWAQGLAKGMAEAGGLTPSTPGYHSFVEGLSRKVAEGFVRGMM
jgi:hypothetical protein